MELNRIENSAVKLTLELEAGKIEEAYKKALNDYAKKLVFDGFRKGKAPVSVVEKKIGNAVREESTFKLMEDNLQETLKTLDKKDQPLPYSVPELQEESITLPFEANKNITYTVKYDVMPEVNLPQYKGLELSFTEKTVSEDHVNEEIERLRQQNAMIIAKDGAIEDKDIVTVDYAELDAEGNAIESTKRSDFTFTVGSFTDFYKFDNEIKGLKKGDSSVIEKTYGDDSGMGTDYLGKTVKISVSVKEVKRKEVPELDDDFAQDIKDEYKTVDDLKNSIRKDLQKETDEYNKSSKLNAVLEALVDKVVIDIPESMVSEELEASWREFSARFGMGEEEMVKLMKANGSSKEEYQEGRKTTVIKSLKSQLILNEIIKKEDIKASEEEIEKGVTKYDSNITKEDPNYNYYKLYAEEDVQLNKAKDILIANNSFTVKAAEEAKEEEPVVEKENQ